MNSLCSQINLEIFTILKSKNKNFIKGLKQNNLINKILGVLRKIFLKLMIKLIKVF